MAPVPTFQSHSLVDVELQTLVVREHGGIGTVPFVQELLVSEDVLCRDVGEGVYPTELLHSLHHVELTGARVLFDMLLLDILAHILGEAVTASFFFMLT